MRLNKYLLLLFICACCKFDIASDRSELEMITTKKQLVNILCEEFEKEGFNVHKRSIIDSLSDIGEVKTTQVFFEIGELKERKPIDGRDYFRIDLNVFNNQVLADSFKKSFKRYKNYKIDTNVVVSFDRGCCMGIKELKLVEEKINLILESTLYPLR